MRVRVFLWLAAAAGIALAACGANAQPTSAAGPVELERAFPGLRLDDPVFLTHAGDSTNRLFVVEQGGTVQVFPNTPSASQRTFLDIRARVNRGGSEEGLLGLAFDPAYASNGHVYVYYTASGPRRSVLSRFTASPEANFADPSTELVLLEIGQPFSNHNGGMIAFGPDGHLYVSLGDGGSGGDPRGNGQDLGTLLGAVLRIDVRNATAQEPYRVPADNPFVGVPGARGEIWAYGLRNPWRFSFDEATGELWAADVGQNDFEEVDVIDRGGNYGWNVMEGRHCFLGPTCNQAGLELPVAEYRHSLGCSVTGGYVYRGADVPALFGAYVYADFCSGRIWTLRYDGERVTEEALLLDTPHQVASFGVDERDELYVVAYAGAIYRFVSEPGTPAPTATPTAPPTATPTAPPTATPTAAPTATPTAPPAATPTAAPTATPAPLLAPPTPPPPPTPTPTSPGPAEVPGPTPVADAAGMPPAATPAPTLAPLPMPPGFSDLPPVGAPAATPPTAPPAATPTQAPNAAIWGAVIAAAVAAVGGALYYLVRRRRRAVP